MNEIFKIHCSILMGARVVYWKKWLKKIIILREEKLIKYEALRKILLKKNKQFMKEWKYFLKENLIKCLWWNNGCNK